MNIGTSSLSANSRLWIWFRSLSTKVAAARKPRRLRLVEHLPLGEKRLLVLVEFSGQQLLLGATSNSISLLDRLPDLGCAKDSGSPVGPDERVR